MRKRDSLHADAASLTASFEVVRDSIKAIRGHRDGDFASNRAHVPSLVLEQFNLKLKEAQEKLGSARPGLKSIQPFEYSTKSQAVDGSVDVSRQESLSRVNFAIAELQTFKPTKDELAAYVKELLGETHAVIPRKHMIVAAIFVVGAMLGIGWTAVRAAVSRAAVAVAAREAEGYRDNAKQASAEAVRLVQTARALPDRVDALETRNADVESDVKLIATNLHEVAYNLWRQLPGDSEFAPPFRNASNFTAAWQTKATDGNPAIPIAQTPRGSTTAQRATDWDKDHGIPSPATK